MNGIARLLALAAMNDEYGVRLRAHQNRFNEYRQRHLTGTNPKAVTGFNLFQTPPEIAENMAQIILKQIKKGSRIMEPSVGLGRLVEPFTKEEVNDLKLQWEAVEESAECIRALRTGLKRLQKTREADFLQMSSIDLGGKFDAIIMNPPFKMGRDIKHINHAYSMLKTGGILVSLCYNGVKQNKELKPLATTWEVLPEKSFASEGTDASVALLTLKK